jgi:hypothetical protein
MVEVNPLRRIALAVANPAAPAGLFSGMLTHTYGFENTVYRPGKLL